MNGSMKKIADISHYQGSINWTEARKELSLVIFRASVGMKQDQKYLGNASACGIPYGVYHYVKAGTAEEAEQEARFFVESANRAAGKPLFYIADIEYKAQTAATTEAVCVAFLETLQKLGCANIGLYINTRYPWAGTAIGMCDIMWIPHWGKNDGEVPAAQYMPKHACDLWQYTSKGRVNGIKGNVDCNHGYFAQPQTGNTDLLRKGDKGDDVKLLQHRLNLLGSQLTEDGIWGVKTDQAVRNYQYKAGLTVDGIVGPKTQAALIRDAILALAAEIGKYLVKHKWHYQDKTYRAKSTFDATRKLEHPGATCSHYVSWVLQDVGLLAAEKRISHDNGKVTGTGNLLGCQVIQAKGKPWDKLPDLRPGDVCVWDSNLAIYAGNGKWYDAGGPFRSNTKDGRYTNVGPVAPYYDRTEPVYYLVRAKV